MENRNNEQYVPIPSIRRLPLYLNFLKNLKEKKEKRVSTTIIADEFGTQSIQVRKDLAITGIRGKPKTGYEIDELTSAIESFLGWDNMEDAFLVGVGNLGQALMGYSRFKNLGLNIVAAFDADPDKTGVKIKDIEILPVSKLAGLIERMHIKIGILTIPQDQAQAVANTMIDAGIKAIWNFTAGKINAPRGVIIEDVMLSSSLSVLTSRLKETIKNEK